VHDRLPVIMSSRPRRRRCCLPSSRHGLVLLSLALLFPRASLAEKKEPIVAIAVFDIVDQGANLGETTLRNLTDYLYGRLIEGGYRVIPRAKILERLQSEKKDSYKLCRDQSCQIDLGRELSAQKTLTTSILKLADTCKVSTQVYDLKKAVGESGITVDAACDEKALVEAVKTIAKTYIERLEAEKKRQAELERKAEEARQEKLRKEEAAREARMRQQLERERIAAEEKRTRQAKLEEERQAFLRREAVRRDRRLAGWVVGSVGVALGVAGLAFVGVSSSNNDSIKEGGFAKAQDIADAADRGALYNRLSWGLGITGIVAAGVGAGLLVFNWKHAEPGPSVSILPHWNGVVVRSGF
jgi:hypothetical protein